MPSTEGGRYKTDEQLREEERSKKLRALDAGRKKRIDAAKRKRKTERGFLLAIAEQVRPIDIQKIAKKQVELALKGDKDALGFLGKYVFGNGRISLAELARPPVVRRSRRA